PSPRPATGGGPPRPSPSTVLASAASPFCTCSPRGHWPWPRAFPSTGASISNPAFDFEVYNRNRMMTGRAARQNRADRERAMRRNTAEQRRGPLVNGRRKPKPKLRSEEHTSELQSRENLVCRLLLEKKN